MLKLDKETFGIILKYLCAIASMIILAFAHAFWCYFSLGKVLALYRDHAIFVNFFKFIIYTFGGLYAGVVTLICGLLILAFIAAILDI